MKNSAAALLSSKFSVIIMCLVLGISSITNPLWAQSDGTGPRWVSDNFEITLRNGKSSKQAIVRMLRSGTKLELLETDEESGYSLVRTSGGTEGWVLSRYLLKSPPAKIVMPDIEARLKASEAKRQELNAQLNELKRNSDQLNRQLSSSESSGQGLQKELDDLRRLSANAIKIDSQNKSLRQTLAESQASVEQLQIENKKLASRASREWFIIGALVVIVGMLIGLMGFLILNTLQK